MAKAIETHMATIGDSPRDLAQVAFSVLVGRSDYVLVPRTATPEAVAAWWQVKNGSGSCSDYAAYAAMVQVASRWVNQIPITEEEKALRVIKKKLVEVAVNHFTTEWNTGYTQALEIILLDAYGISATYVPGTYTFE